MQTVGFIGFYPAITWVTYMLIGACVGSWLLRRRLTTARALRGGAVAALVVAAAIVSDLASRELAVAQLRSDGASIAEAEKMLTAEGQGTPLSDRWVAVLNAAPHTGSSADVLRTAGVAIVVIAILVATSAALRPPLPRPLDALARAASLTIYVVQFGSVPIMLIFASLVLQETDAAPAIQAITLVAHVVMVVSLGALLSKLNREGRSRLSSRSW